MLSTSVYGFENEISQICALLKVLGYNVWNSHLGTIRVNPALSNLENCLKAVEDCDLFLGIIRTQCGTVREFRSQETCRIMQNGKS